jgi:hypothetical protein
MTTLISELEEGDRFTFEPKATATVYVYNETIGGVSYYSEEKDRENGNYGTGVLARVYPVPPLGAADYIVVDDANIGPTPSHTLQFGDGTLVTVFLSPDEGPTGAVVVLVDNTKHAVRATLNTNAEVRLWAVPDED